jgi:hypothetical protein
VSDSQDSKRKRIEERIKLYKESLAELNDTYKLIFERRNTTTDPVTQRKLEKQLEDIDNEISSQESSLEELENQLNTTNQNEDPPTSSTTNFRDVEEKQNKSTTSTSPQRTSKNNTPIIVALIGFGATVIAALIGQISVFMQKTPINQQSVKRVIPVEQIEIESFPEPFRNSELSPSDISQPPHSLDQGIPEDIEDFNSRNNTTDSKNTESIPIRAIALNLYQGYLTE